MTDCKQILETSRDIPHTIVYGPEGSGKLTLVNAWLSEKFGRGATRLKKKTWDCLLLNKTKPISVNMMHSQVHDVLDPAEWAQQGRNILNKYMRELCFAGGACTISQFLQKPQQKILVLRHTDVLSESAQQNIRFLLDEMPSVTCSVILLTDSLYKLLPGLVSRCQIVKRHFHAQDVENVLTHICKAEGMKLPLQHDICKTIASECLGNWRYALSHLQMLSVSTNGHMSVVQAATKKLLSHLKSDDMIDDSVVSNIRKDAYTCLAVCGVHHPAAVLKACIKELSGRASSEQVAQMIEMAWDVDMLMCRGSRPIMHIERFLINLWKSGLVKNQF